MDGSLSTGVSRDGGGSGGGPPADAAVPRAATTAPRAAAASQTPLSRRRTHALLQELKQSLADLKVQEQGLLQQRLALEQRAAAARLLARVMLEAAAHRARMGVADDDAWQRALREQAASLVADAAPPAATSSNDDARGDDEATAIAVGPLEARLAHLAPGRSLLGLEAVTREEVDAVRALDVPGFVARIAAQIERAKEATTVLDRAAAAAEAHPRSAARRAAPTAAEVAAARAALDAAGAERMRLNALGLIWSPQVMLHAVTCRTDTGAPASGPDDAPVDVLDKSLRAAQLYREVRHCVSTNA